MLPDCSTLNMFQQRAKSLYMFLHKCFFFFPAGWKVLLCLLSGDSLTGLTGDKTARPETCLHHMHLSTVWQSQGKKIHQFSWSLANFCYSFDGKQWAWQSMGRGGFFFGVSWFKNLLKISLLDLIPQSRNNAFWHSGMQQRHTQPKWTVIWKRFCNRSVPEAELSFMIVLSAVEFQKAGFNPGITMKDNQYSQE